MLVPSGARVRLERGGKITVETQMTDIGTGSYTVLGQTAAEMLGVPLQDVEVRLGDSDYPISSGSGGSFGANSSATGSTTRPKNCVILSRGRQATTLRRRRSGMGPCGRVYGTRP